jgi:hypothetical protein
MKKLIPLSIALLALLAAPLARAWSYSDGDLLLVFSGSSGNNIYDVEYDLGSVSNLLGHTNGYTTTITGWNSSLVTGQFGTDLTGVNVILAAATSVSSPTPTAWVTSTDPNVYAYNPGGAGLTSVHGVVNAVGYKPANFYYLPAAAGTPTNAYVINATTGSSVGAAYDYIVTGGRGASASTWDGIAPFSGVPVDQTIPGSFDFWQVGKNYGAPDQLIGIFTITANGVLTFTAGPPQPTITAVSHSGTVSTLQFTTEVGNQYSVTYTNQLGGSGAWPVDPNTLTGDGNIDTLSHTNNSSIVEFYRVNTH